MSMALIVCVQGQNSEQFDVCSVHVLRLVLFLKLHLSQLLSEVCTTITTVKC